MLLPSRILVNYRFRFLVQNHLALLKYRFLKKMLLKRANTRRLFKIAWFEFNVTIHYGLLAKCIQLRRLKRSTNGDTKGSVKCVLVAFNGQAGQATMLSKPLLTVIQEVQITIYFHNQHDHAGNIQKHSLSFPIIFLNANDSKQLDMHCVNLIDMQQHTEVFSATT